MTQELLRLDTLTAMRYITPLHEGGSLPAVVEADDGARYVMKFVGAGHGPKALVAEVIAGFTALALGLDVPEMVLLELDPDLGRSEPNPEIRDLLRASAGLNLGFRYLEGAFAYNPMLRPPVPAELASRIVWFDSYVTNVDRTARNVNMLLAEGRLWLIDHGAALYFHHTWSDMEQRIRNPFPLVREHTLLPFAGRLQEADVHARALLTERLLHGVVGLVPDVWLQPEAGLETAQAQRAAYLDFLVRRRDLSSVFVEEAVDAYARHG